MYEVWEDLEKMVCPMPRFRPWFGRHWHWSLGDHCTNLAFGYESLYEMSQLQRPHLGESLKTKDSYPETIGAVGRNP
jgi:hypothetical protein